MNEIYEIIVKLTHICFCNENRMSSSCHVSMAELKGISSMEINKSMPCSELAERMNLSPSRISRITDNLTKKGYLSRQIKDQDRRTTFLSLTKKGEKIKKEINQEQKKLEQLLVSELETQEVESIKKGLIKIVNILENNIKGDRHVGKIINRS